MYNTLRVLQTGIHLVTYATSTDSGQSAHLCILIAIYVRREHNACTISRLACKRYMFLIYKLYRTM